MHGVVTMSGFWNPRVVLENPTGVSHARRRVGVIEDLKVGDRVSFPGYGVGVVETVSGPIVWIRWENGGLLRHYLADLAEHLRPAE